MNLSLYDLLSVGALIAALQFLTGLWIKTRLESSIKHEYDKQLEEFRAEIRKREQAARIAELLTIASGQTINLAEANQLIWEMSLWLPANIVRDMTQCLCRSGNAKKPRELLADIRKLLHGENDDLKPGEIAHVISFVGSTASITTEER